MTLELTLNVNLDDIIDEIDDLLVRQIPYAAQLAINNSVFKATAKVKDRMTYYIQGGPVGFTKRGVQYSKAKNKRNIQASIFIPDRQWKYMRWVIGGGRKQWNRSKAGIGKPIYKNTKFNKYGNIPGRRGKERVWRELLKRGKGTVATPLKGGLAAGQFVATINGTTGLWKRFGKGGGQGKIKLLVVFNNEPVFYNKSFPFQKLAIKFVSSRFKIEFNKKLKQVVNRESKRLQIR